MSHKVGMVSLGCSKNQVDGEVLLASLQDAGFTLSNDTEQADAVIVNTCGFIESAKQESIGEILDLAQLKKEGKLKAIVVTGCLAERYQEEIRKEMPEVDGVVGIGANQQIADVLKRVLEGEKTERFPPKLELPLSGKRVLSTPKHYAYLKISEGCDNCCTYCAIPLIRGRFRSRTIESVVEEAKGLAESGVKELIVIAQDTTRFGEDLYGKPVLVELLRELCKIDGVHWIRLLYCYPNRISDELLDIMANEDKILKYMDLPLQHCSGKVLAEMNRYGDIESLTALITKIRRKIPGLVLRTTFIAGFPGETEEDFEEMAEFVRDIRFDRMGCFAYSQEEDTPAASFEGQISEEEKQRRVNLIMESQMRIMQEMGEAQLGREIEVLVEGYDETTGFWYGRSEADSPDIDGCVLFTVSGKKPELGSFVMVRVEECVDCDLIGALVE
ncbi:MAG: 30S ribosomal protein S12 methylthiotransferase RimO [Clostridiales bacterium]|jgi:ribosomal protein S12 methylthiotransferase|nr:30S ribosomal protein S12 methylthiotransferase RimO [Clostridiales bacterium]